jgi:hypothetical protein
MHITHAKSMSWSQYNVGIGDKHSRHVVGEISSNRVCCVLLVARANVTPHVKHIVTTFYRNHFEMKPKRGVRPYVPT